MPEKLAEFINYQLGLRRVRLIMQKDIDVEILPKFADAFRNTHYIFCWCEFKSKYI